MEFGLLGVGKTSPYTPPPAKKIAESAHEAQSEAATEMDALELRERQIDELLLTDPLAAEQMILDGDLKERDDPHPKH